MTGLGWEMCAPGLSFDLTVSDEFRSLGISFGRYTEKEYWAVTLTFCSNYTICTHQNVYSLVSDSQECDGFFEVIELSMGSKAEQLIAAEIFNAFISDTFRFLACGTPQFLGRPVLFEPLKDGEERLERFIENKFKELKEKKNEPF